MLRSKLTIEVHITNQGGTERFPRWAPTTNKATKCSTVRGHGFNRAGEPCSQRVTVRYSPLVPTWVYFIQGRNFCSGRHGKPWLGIIYPDYACVRGEVDCTAYHGPHDGVSRFFPTEWFPSCYQLRKGTLDGHTHVVNPCSTSIQKQGLGYAWALTRIGVPLC